MPPARILAVVNQKGGVGKTTTAVNLAASVAAAEERTLLVDLDPQGNASSAYGIREPSRHVYDALIGDCVTKDVCLPTELPFLRVLPSGRDLVGAEIELVTAERREHRLAEALAPLRSEFDVILIDCPPSLGLLTLNALTASDAVLIPLQCEYYALEGLASLVETIDLVRGGLNPKLTIGGLVLTMVDRRNNLSRDVEDEVRNHFGDRVFQTVVPRNVRLSEAPSHGKPILLYDVHSRGSVAYLQLAKELMQRLAPDGAGEASVTPSAAPAGSTLRSDGAPPQPVEVAHSDGSAGDDHE